MIIDFDLLDSKFSSKFIGENIPIYQLMIKGNNVSEYYSKISQDSWSKLGYRNFNKHNAVTPETMKNNLKFNEFREYSNGKKRKMMEQEKAIWESHYGMWEKVVNSRKSSIIIEHDCILKSKIRSGIRMFPLFSFAITDRNTSLAACAYYITPWYAKTFIDLANSLDINMPVDAFIHNYEPWYSFNMNEKDIKDGIYPAYHYINPEVGTVKEKAKR
jgi:GR25 family glycosyltransferase involved in LPS biosynthesis